jgi:hypothetical protein
MRAITVIVLFVFIIASFQSICPIRKSHVDFAGCVVHGSGVTDNQPKAAACPTGMFRAACATVGTAKAIGIEFVPRATPDAAQLTVCGSGRVTSSAFVI